MAELEQALDRLLADPEAMAQIMDLAGKLGVTNDGEKEEAVSEAPPGEEASNPHDLSQLAPLFSRMGGQEGGDPRSDALLRALRPYLSEARRRKLDRAVRLSSMAQMARQALALWKEGDGSV